MKPNALCCPGWASVTMPATSGEAMLVPPPVSLVNFGGLFFGNASIPVANPVYRSAPAAL